MLTVTTEGPVIGIETNKLHVRIRTEGYVSGVAAGGLVDKQTESFDLGFGLQIADFLLEPAKQGGIPPGQYKYGAALPVHGDIPKRYVEGPQICTMAKKLPYEIIQGDGFVAVRQWFTFTQAYGDYQPGSQWEQLLIFPENTRYYLGCDRITSANDCPALIFRQDIPGHIKHDRGDSFEHVYLSYEGAWLPSTEFLLDFPPDEKYFYRRNDERVPKHMIRAYQVKSGGEAGAWLAGITLNPADVWEAWCHQRGYVCMIQEIGGRPIKRGETFGAASMMGWFDGPRQMEEESAKYAGASGFVLTGPAEKPNGFKPVAQGELPPVKNPLVKAN